MKKERFKAVPSVYLLLRQDNKILLGLRENTGWQDGYYALLAGHMDGNEKATEALAREAFEEAGIVIDPRDLTLACVMYRKSEDRENVDLFFECQKWQGSVENKEPEKCAGLQFFPTDNLPDRTIAYMRTAIENSEKGMSFHEIGFDD